MVRIWLLTQPFNFHCTIAADLLANVQSIIPANNTLARGVRTLVDVTLAMKVIEGWSIPEVGDPRTNFNLTIMLSQDEAPDVLCQGTFEDCGFMLVDVVLDANIPQSGINKTATGNMTFSVELDVLVTADDCDLIHYFCVNITEGHNASFVEWNVTNNLQCQDISSVLLCKPGNTG